MTSALGACRIQILETAAYALEYNLLPKRPKTQSLERTTTANAKFIACRIWPTLGMAAAPMSQNTATGRLAVVVTTPLNQMLKLN